MACNNPSLLHMAMMASTLNGVCLTSQAQINTFNMNFFPGGFWLLGWDNGFLSWIDYSSNNYPSQIASEAFIDPYLVAYSTDGNLMLLPWPGDGTFIAQFTLAKRSGRLVWIQEDGNRVVTTNAMNLAYIDGNGCIAPLPSSTNYAQLNLVDSCNTSWYGLAL